MSIICTNFSTAKYFDDSCVTSHEKCFKTSFNRLGECIIKCLSYFFQLTHFTWQTLRALKKVCFSQTKDLPFFLREQKSGIMQSKIKNPRLEETTCHCLAMSVLLLNLRKLQRILQTFFVGDLTSKKCHVFSKHYLLSNR